MHQISSPLWSGLLLLIATTCRATTPITGHTRTHPRVAFFAGLKEKHGPYTDASDITFDNVVTNVGDAFNGWAGRFVTPYSGTYSFTVVLAADVAHRAAADLVMNNKLVLTAWSDCRSVWVPSSNTAILTLKKGDNVWLKNHLLEQTYIYGDMYTTFSGHLLFTSKIK